MKRFIGLAALALAALLALQGCGCDDSNPYPPFIGPCTPDACMEYCISLGLGWGHCEGDKCECTGTGDGYTDTPVDPYHEPFPTGTGAIQGRVYTPEPPTGASVTKFPISGALVYITDVEPTPIPSGVYCQECVEMPETQPHDFSNPDGTFYIGNLPGNTYLLVVQKGEFRKVRYIDVVDDTTIDVPEEFTTFPNEHYPDAGDFTPSIAVALGSYDDMQDIMAKIGLCDIDTEGAAILDTCNHIEFYDNGGGFGGDYPDFDSLLRDPVLMDRYHIIFAPCSSSFSGCTDPTIQASIRRWVDAGGKWYIADWSYDVLEQPFPDFLDFEGNDASPNDANMASMSFNTTGRAVDTELRQWIESSLMASPDSIEFHENWDCIQALGAVPGTEPDGTPITIVPDTYCEGPVTRSNDGCISPNAPLTLTFPYGCGRVLYTTYHTVGEMGGPHPDLLIQEQILVYMILEIGLCTEPVIII